MIASTGRKQRFAELKRPVTIYIAFSLALTFSVLLIVRMLGPELAMMALSVMFFLGALLAAAIAWFIGSRRTSRNLSPWDVAGGLVLVGVAASVLADPEHAVELFEHLFQRRFVLQ
ncbi:putative protein OS=Afipia felis OX=1035 GN=BN961_01910 PE=4 SV=1 [Afipia felis]